MSKLRRHVGQIIGSFGALAVAGVLSGCAAPTQVTDTNLEQRIQSAVSAQDHEALAVEYERQAQVDSANANRHVGFTDIYRNRGSRGSSLNSLRFDPAASHEELARAYRKAAGEKTALAKMHRDIARQGGQR